MRCSTEPKYRKYVKGYGFLSFAKKIGNKYGKKIMAAETKTEIDAAEATGDSIGNKIANKIISMGKLKEKSKESRRNLHSARKNIKNN